MTLTNEDAVFLKAVLEEKILGLQNFMSHDLETRIRLLKEIHTDESEDTIRVAVGNIEKQMEADMLQTGKLLARITVFLQ